MRALTACVLLAACATAPQPTPPEQVAGCWVNRDAGAVIMRWLPDPGAPGVLAGVRIAVGINGQRSERFTLEAEGDGWKLCRAGDGRCWGVARGDSGSLEGGRVFIDGAGDSLRIAVAGDGPERVIFQGRRDSCQ